MSPDTIVNGSALDVLKTFESDSIDCCITSPPYWALRDYKTEGFIWGGKEGCEHEWVKTKDRIVGNAPSRHTTMTGGMGIRESQGIVSSNYCSKCNAWRGSLGLEPTFNEYLDHLIEIFAQVKRVIKKTGSIFVNIGDTYSRAGTSNVADSWTKGYNCDKRWITKTPDKTKSGIPEKSLCGIPERFKIRMIDELGLICRNTIIWYKPNCMPSSARDRFTVDFEYLYFFTKSARYYFETQYEPMLEESKERYSYGFNVLPRAYTNGAMPITGGKKCMLGNSPTALGRIKRCVWRISTKPFSGAHFAVFPYQLIETPIRATCPERICNKCDKTSKIIYNESFIPTRPGRYVKDNMKSRTASDPSAVFHKSDWSCYRLHPVRTPIAISDCGCGQGFHPGIVLDPFMGSGTTAVTAKTLGRNYIGIELNPSYIELANARLGKTLLTYL